MSENKMALTEAVCAAAVVPEGKTEHRLWDMKQPGLALRIGARAKTWVVVYRIDGAGRSRAPQTYRLGAFPAVSVADARRAAKAKMGEVARGNDPAGEKREQRRKEKATLAVALDDYEGALKARKVVRIKEGMSVLRRGLKGLENRDLGELELRDALAPIEKLEAAGMTGAAYDLRKHLRSLLAWAQSSGRVKYNVLAGVRRQRTTRAQQIEKDTLGKALEDAELRAVWTAADPATVFGRYLRFLLATGCRRTEAANLTRDMIREDRIVLPPLLMKQGRQHEIPLTATLREIIDACPITSSKLLFPSSRSGGPMVGWSKMLPKFRKTCPVEFTLHDCRRTVRTGFTRLGIDSGLAEFALGHQPAELIRIYDRADRWPERVAVFERWHGHIARVVEATEGSNVLVFVPARAAV
ncbi:MAG: integrase arm-type DNA-binding domain-containing protein [Rhodospirillaceae bacterium]